MRVSGWSWGLVAVFAMARVAAAQNDIRLVDAVKAHDKPAVRALLKQRVNVNTPQPDGATALHWAVHFDDLETADLLIRAGAKVTALNDLGVAPLSLACTNANAAMVEMLLKAGAPPDTALPTGETVLMTASRTGNADVVTALLARGASVNAKETTRGQTPLMWAAAEGHAEIARVLIQHGADVHARSTAGFTPLLLVARNGDLNTTRILLGAGANVNETAPDGTTALLIAAIRGHTAYGAFLLDEGANPNLGPGFNALHWAVGEWATGLTGLMDGVITDDNEWKPLGGLRGAAKLEFVKALLAHGADPNMRTTTNPRYEGAGTGRGRGSVIGSTPFMLAARASDASVMRLLLDSGADPKLLAPDKATSLMLAAGLGGTRNSWATETEALETVKLTFELGADVNAVNATGDTALHGAAYRGWDSVVRFLVDKGANMNVKNDYRWTPLTIAEGVDGFAAGLSDSPSTAKLLRELGAEPTPPDVERNPTKIKAR